MRQLQQAGLLRLDTQCVSANVFWLGIPRIGKFVKQVAAGRREVLQLLKRQRYKELLRSELDNRKLRFSTLGMDFHLTDLFGLELVEKKATTRGDLIKLVKR